MKTYSVKTYLTRFTLTVTAALVIITLSAFSGWLVNLRQYTSITSQYASFSILSNEINQAYVSLDDYIQNPAPEVEARYQTSMTAVRTALETIGAGSETPDIYYTMVGIENMIAKADQINQEIIHTLSLDSFHNNYASHRESRTLLNYINLELASAASLQNAHMQTRLSAITNRIYLVLSLLAVISLLTILSLLAFSMDFSRKISAPIRQISGQAEELAGGNLKTEDIPEQNMEEFSRIAISLNTMKAELARTIATIKEQSDIAVRLKQSELENLRISNDLKNTELRVMQAQINPHFLFNTLNSISRLALSSGSHEIVSLIDALSQMLRYNLNHLDRPITLKEELENLENYLYIQEVRFKDRLHFRIENRSERLQLGMPCLTLQPIVENAILHGLKPYNYEGTVHIAITDFPDYTKIVIQDDGVGMEQPEIRRMVGGTAESSPDSVKHTSIGFKNVMGRLQSFFERDDCILVESQLGEGTTITLKLYCKRRDPHAPCIDC